MWTRPGKRTHVRTRYKQGQRETTEDDKQRWESRGRLERWNEKDGTFYTAALWMRRKSRGRGEERKERRNGCCRNAWQSFNEGTKFDPYAHNTSTLTHTVYIPAGFSITLCDYS